MIQLALVRHAKADWAFPGADDHGRMLTSTGIRDAPVMAARVMRRGARPHALLSSTAVRARTTAQAFAAAFGMDVHETPDLYGAPADELLRVARETGESEVMIIAHDPGVSILATSLAGREVRMTTCAVALFTWDHGDWDIVGSTPPDDVWISEP